MNLQHYFTNPFDTPRVSMDNLLTFTTDHMARMAANNPGGIFSARITATTGALAAVESAYTDDKTAAGLKQARVQMKDAFRASLPANIGQIYGAVTAKYGTAGAQVAECFPKGRSVFGSAKDADLAAELQALVNGLTALQPGLGADVLAEANGLVTGWQAVFTGSGTSKGGKASSQADKASAKAALALELFKNLLTLALNFPGQPDQADAYMQGSLLDTHNHSSGATPAPAPAAATTGAPVK
jgi:hypothetical protein